MSFDIRGRDPAYVAREGVLAFRTLRAELEAAGLCLNTDKIGFLTSAKEVSKEVDKFLTTMTLPTTTCYVTSVDATATRRRRVTHIKKRFIKGSGRTGILRLAPSTRYRLHRGAVRPVMTWAQANGLAETETEGASCS